MNAVFFDVDETLVDFDAAARAAHRELFDDDGAGYERWCELTPVFWPMFTHGELTFTEMRDARMARYLREQGLDGDADAYEARRWELVERSFSLYDDVRPVLDDLRAAGYRLGVITNNESVHQRRKLATVGLADYFDAVVISGEQGVAKPDAGIFTRGCELIGVAPEQALHVGDLLDADARGARDAGLTGVWLDRVGAHDGSDVGVPVVSTLAEVPALLPS